MSEAAVFDTVPADEDDIDVLLRGAELLTWEAAAAVAAQLEVIHECVVTAKQNPEIYLPAEPAQELSHREYLQFAERSAVFDLSLRLRLPENTIWEHYHLVDTLRSRLPRIWQEFRGGTIPYLNAKTAAMVIRSIPADAGIDNEFEDAIGDAAMKLVPSKFRIKARITRERLHPLDLQTRHAAARAERRVEIEPDLDQMAWLHLYTEASSIYRAKAHLDASAVRARNAGDERTLAQLRADAAADLLTGVGTPFEVRAHVAITIPLTTLLDEPDLLTTAHTDTAILDGYGPIDPTTAQALAAAAPSFRRIFTDPVDGVELSMGRTTYRPTTAQREWLRRKYGTCTAATCTIPVPASDVDHLTDWQHGGATDDDNLAPAHRGHHRLRHLTKTRVERHPDGRITWTTPTGHHSDNTPSPYTPAPLPRPSDKPPPF